MAPDQPEGTSTDMADSLAGAKQQLRSLIKQTLVKVPQESISNQSMVPETKWQSDILNSDTLMLR